MDLNRCGRRDDDRFRYGSDTRRWDRNVPILDLTSVRPGASASIIEGINVRVPVLETNPHATWTLHDSPHGVRSRKSNPGCK